MFDSTELQIAALKTLRTEFEPHQISKLPKPTKSQTDAVKADFKAGIRCGVCGGWHHKDVVHLDYVGHAALTDRLLNADPFWAWEPVAFGSNGLPATDDNGGLWIRLTVCGRSMLGYGHPDGKKGGDAIKEAIGDALRNAAMRMGAALDLWHKGDLHKDDDVPEVKDAPAKKAVTPSNNKISSDQFNSLIKALDETNSDKVAFCDAFKIESIAAMPEAMYNTAIAAINKKRKAP